MKVSMASLIYKSPKYAEFVYNGIKKYTPMLEKKEAEFYFCCNNATNKVLSYLEENDIPHLIFKTEQQPKYPKNIGYIYKCWNFAVSAAEGDIVVLLNSDMWVSKDWLENLLKFLKKGETVVTSRLVESGKLFSHLPHTIVKNFGRTPETFKEEDFEIFAESVKENKAVELGTFMPLAIYKEDFLKAGGYPEGNRILPDGRQISGDWIFFYERLKNMNIIHLNSWSSITYHIQEGESCE